MTIVIFIESTIAFRKLLQIIKNILDDEHHFNILKCIFNSLKVLG